MAKQLIRGMTMVALLVAIALVTAVASASGQSTISRADIPFEFVAGNKTLAAGHYRITNVSSGAEVLKIAGTESGQSVFRLTISVQASARKNEGKLVFRRYGNHYFLAEVWMTGESAGRQLMKSKAEKSIERELASNRSQRGPAFERVEIALLRD